jgi:hypothetical protein
VSGFVVNTRKKRRASKVAKFDGGSSSKCRCRAELEAAAALNRRRIRPTPGTPPGPPVVALRTPSRTGSSVPLFRAQVGPSPSRSLSGTNNWLQVAIKLALTCPRVTVGACRTEWHGAWHEDRQVAWGTKPPPPPRRAAGRRPHGPGPASGLRPGRARASSRLPHWPSQLTVARRARAPPGAGGETLLRVCSGWQPQWAMGRRTGHWQAPTSVRCGFSSCQRHRPSGGA